MPPIRRGEARGGAVFEEFEELRRRIEELENRRDGDAEIDSKFKVEIEREVQDEEIDLDMHLITYLSKRGSAEVEVLCYDRSMKV